jgi:hypothetical protein
VTWVAEAKSAVEPVPAVDDIDDDRQLRLLLLGEMLVEL